LPGLFYFIDERGQLGIVGSHVRVFGANDALGAGLEVLGQVTHPSGHLLALALPHHIEYDAAATFFVGVRKHLAEGVFHRLGKLAPGASSVSTKKPR
jgi:hypothetical protein